MSLSPDVQDIFGSYEFSEEERRHLIDYLEENKKQMTRQIVQGEVDWDRTAKLKGELSEDGKALVNELIDYCTEWEYSDLDWVDLCKDLIKELA